MTERNELADWDEGTIRLAIGGMGRLILDTMHGQIIIDVRWDDVNAFAPEKEGLRTDIKLLP